MPGPDASSTDLLHAQTVLHAIDAAVLLVDAATGRVLAANPAARALFGLSGPLPGPGELFDPAELPLERLAAGINGLECLARHAGGATFPARVSCRELDPGRLACTVTDLSALRRAESRSQACFENIIEGVFQSSPEGTFLMVNPALAEILGFASPEELIQHFRDLRSQLYVDPADRDTLLTTLRREGRIKNFETRFVCKDGSAKWISLTAREVRDPDTGGLLYIEGLNIDITARKQAEQALRESEEKFRRTFDQSPIGASMVALDSRFLRANEAFCRITGYSEEELKRLTFAEITHPDDRDESVSQYERVLAGEIDAFEQDKRYIHKDGRPVWVHLSAGLVRDSQGRALYLLPVVQDINDRVQTEQAMRQVFA